MGFLSIRKFGAVMAVVAMIGTAGIAVAGSPTGEPIFFAPHAGEPIPASQQPQVSAAARAAAAKATIKSGVTFNVTYLDGAGVGFNDATHGTNRKAVLQAVLTYIGNQLNQTGGVCDVEVQASQTDGTGFLASAGTYYFALNGYYPGFAQQHITTGTDASGAVADIVVTVDFGYTWNNSTGSVGVGQYDLYSVLLHEITHGLGISSLTTSTGASQFLAGNSTNTFTSYDNLLYAISGGTKTWNAGTQAFQLANLTGGDNYIEFRGTNAQTAYPGSVFPRIYTPASYAQGSSVAHWQFNSPTPSTAVMRHAISANVENRTYQAFELQALKDLGYTLAASDVRDWQFY